MNAENKESLMSEMKELRKLINKFKRDEELYRQQEMCERRLGYLTGLWFDYEHGEEADFLMGRV
jgi:hypothetical protein